MNNSAENIHDIACKHYIPSRDDVFLVTQNNLTWIYILCLFVSFISHAGKVHDKCYLIYVEYNPWLPIRNSLTSLSLASQKYFTLIPRLTPQKTSIVWCHIAPTRHQLLILLIVLWYLHPWVNNCIWTLKCILLNISEYHTHCSQMASAG